jgi:hypothetical protein
MNLQGSNKIIFVPLVAQAPAESSGAGRTAAPHLFLYSSMGSPMSA